jgi:hypothetical protein
MSVSIFLKDAADTDDPHVYLHTEFPYLRSAKNLNPCSLSTNEFC